MGLIKSNGGFSEGEINNKWILNRMIRRNKNVLTATTGPTGSGKSYQDLRRMELWYLFYFKKPLPIENVCFSIGELMKRLTSGELQKGDFLILEEAGANLGSLDFQTKISKTFTYVLQTFRSLNIGISFNLPYLTMLNKQTRTLIHALFETLGINYEKSTSTYKAFYRQVNNSTGKIYNKHFRIKHQGMSVPVKRFTISLPSKELCDAYEKKKKKFVTELTQEFSDTLDIQEKELNRKLARNDLTEMEQEYYEDWVNGLTEPESAKKRGKGQSTVHEARQRCKKKGYSVLKTKKPKENRENRD